MMVHAGYIRTHVLVMQGVVHDNLLMSLRSVLEAMKELGINLTSEDKKVSIQNSIII